MRGLQENMSMVILIMCIVHAERLTWKEGGLYRPGCHGERTVKGLLNNPREMRKKDSARFVTSHGAVRGFSE